MTDTICSNIEELVEFYVENSEEFRTGCITVSRGEVDMIHDGENVGTVSFQYNNPWVHGRDSHTKSIVDLQLFYINSKLNLLNKDT